MAVTRIPLRSSPSFLVLRENGKHDLDPDLGTSPINQSSSDWLTLQFLSNWLIPANQALVGHARDASKIGFSVRPFIDRGIDSESAVDPHPFGDH